jgi:exodeoxyribonuclease-5
MRFSPQQDGALCAANRWLRAPSAQVFRLFGYAGTGKTTLAKHLAAHIDGRVRFAAYTGKAAHVMRIKGCKDAGTLHSLIYICSETADGPWFELTDQSPLAEAALLIVDECSMVDTRLGDDILSFGVPVLVLGDPEQLPPVRGAGFFTAAAQGSQWSNVTSALIEAKLEQLFARCSKPRCGTTGCVRLRRVNSTNARSSFLPIHHAQPGRHL